MNLFRIFTKSSKLSVSSLLGFGLSFISSLAIARFLGPENVGILALVGVWRFYTTLIKPGLVAAAGRDMPYLLGQGKDSEARRLQNIAFTGESIYYAIPFVLLLVASFLYESSIVRTAMWLSAFLFLATAFRDMFVGILYAYQQFDLIARLRFIISVVSPIGILLTLSWLGIYSALLIPTLAALVILGIIYRNKQIFNYRLYWKWSSAREMLQVGMPQVVLGFVGWAYFMSDRPALLAAGISLAMLGYYSFASGLIQGVAQVFYDFAAVLQPILWQEMGRQGSVRKVTDDLVHIWVPYMMAASFAATLGQAGYGAVIAWVAPNFVPSVPVFDILVFLLVFSNSITLPNLILNSKGINRPNLIVMLFTLGLAINVVALYLLARAGYALTVIAMASMVIDLMIAIVGYASIHKYLFSSWRSSLDFYGWLAGGAAIAVGLYFVFQWGPYAYSSENNVWVSLLLRALTALLVWGCVGLLILRWLREHRTVLEAVAARVTLSG